MSKRSYRNMVDLTPGDKSGHSWMGLKRNQAKTVATVFLVAGASLADPPFSILPTDFINLWLAGVIDSLLGIGLAISLVLTYTFIAWGLIVAGVMIYPYNSRKLFSGYVNKFKKLLLKVVKNPLLLGVGIYLFFLMYKWYSGVI